jgi:Acyltransferase family.
MSKPFLKYIEWFRGLSILLIVLSHLRSSALSDTYYYVLQNATVYFLFISGFLFHYLYKPGESVPSFYIKKLKRLVLPYLVASLVGFTIWSVQTRTIPGAVLIVRSLLTGTGNVNVGHWFIPAMLLIFSTYPVLRALCVRRKLLSVLAAAGLLVTVATFRSRGNANPFLNALHFYGVFLFGMTTSAWWDSWSRFLERHFWPVVISGTLAFTALMWLVPSSSVLNMETVIGSGSWTPDWSTAARLVMILPLLAVLMRLGKRGHDLAFLSTVGRMSFGIFFYHGFLIYFLNSDWVNRFLPQNSLPVLALNAAIVFAILWAFLSLAKKLLGKNSVYLFGY